MSRLALTVRGVVQGVGFRPFVRRAALAHGLVGWVQNGRDAVRIEVQGADDELGGFLHALAHDLPGAARIDALESAAIADGDDRAFSIVDSDDQAPVRAQLPADLATCEDCLAEIRDPRARRHRYPFTNCTQCGPRYTIVQRVPYDRDNTTMRGFAMCAACAAEFTDVGDRRYHAQPIACPACGPRLSVEIADAVMHLRRGEIVALKGLGGFQLLVDAAGDAAIARLRERKRRPDQPFATMFRSLAEIAEHASISDAEAAALTSPAAPIVLLRRRRHRASAGSCRSPWIGAMLPTSPLHHLLLDDFGGPLICTSGNLHDEPISIEREALGEVADVVVDHDRPIARPVDDSLVRAGRRGVEVLRRARGYAPSVVAQVPTDRTIVAVGAHLKSTVALVHRGQLIASQHLGDLASPAARDLLAETVRDMCRFYDARPELVACDMHPDYASTLLAERLGLPIVRVQHHHAHVAAVIAEHQPEMPVLGLAWDGTGLGDDGTIWGGEALLCRRGGFERVGHLDSFPLPRGHTPRKIAQALTSHASGNADTPHGALPCTSVGRLFDGVASLIDLVHSCTFEGHAALALEACASGCSDDVAPYPHEVAALVASIRADVARGTAKPVIAKRFHLALIELGVALARRGGVAHVALSGGCFVNRILADGLHRRLADDGFEVLAGRGVPPGDNGISVGQAWVASCV